MRFTRQNKILELIAAGPIETQEELANALRDAGFQVTQATVSRDIKDLGLVKKSISGSKPCYAAPASANPDREKLHRVMKDTVLSVTPAENIIVIKTLPGCANAAAEAIDTAGRKDIVGTLAGDNTIMVVIDCKEDVKSALAFINSVIL